MNLIPTNKGDPIFRALMAVHYSQPKGFVGRQLLYRIEHGGLVYGGIAFGSPTKNLPGRKVEFGLVHGLNNNFYHIEKQQGQYPYRNFTVDVLVQAENIVALDYAKRYQHSVYWFESLVELPRTGEIYRRAGYTETGITIGYTCKRPGGSGTDSWSGRREWNQTDLRPKRVFQKFVGDALIRQRER